MDQGTTTTSGEAVFLRGGRLILCPSLRRESRDERRRQGTGPPSSWRWSTVVRALVHCLHGAGPLRRGALQGRRPSIWPPLATVDSGGRGPTEPQRARGLQRSRARGLAPSAADAVVGEALLEQGRLGPDVASVEEHGLLEVPLDGLEVRPAELVHLLPRRFTASWLPARCF